MGILTDLNSGKKIKFEVTDTDSWSYQGNILEQTIDGTATGNTLQVLELTEEYITVDWGGPTSTLLQSQILIID